MAMINEAPFELHNSGSITTTDAAQSVLLDVNYLCQVEYFKC